MPNAHLPETIETVDWSDRELLLRTYYQVLETNGRVCSHETELYGDAVHQVKGLKLQVATNTDYIKTQRTTIRTIAGLVGLVGFGNIVALVVAFARGF